MKAIVQKIIFMMCCGIVLLGTDCKHTPTGNRNATAMLTLEDISCTEAWLKLSVTNMTNPKVVIKRDSTVLDTLLLTTTDTTITDTGLLPSHTYTYTTTGEGITAQVQARTMDTTSHSFSFTTTLLGDGSGSSMLYDVAIINDTLAYACGAIYFSSSICNLVKWNGQQWDTMHIPVTLTYNSSQMITDQDPLKTIYAFNENDVWVVSQAGGVSHWNGTQWVMLSIPFNQGPGACNKMWGTSSSDLYFVGNNGRIIHYNGSNWTKIESGTGLNIYDIHGATNVKTGETEIYTVAANQFVSSDKAIFHISGNTAQSVFSANIPSSITGIWFMPGKQYYIVGSGIFTKRSMVTQDAWQELPSELTQYYIYAISGAEVNDVIICGSYGEALHFNGLTWKSYIRQTYMNGEYYRVVIRNNTVIAAGYNSSMATILIGKR